MEHKKALWQWSAWDLSKAIKNREITCQEAVLSSIDRMNEINPELNAVVVDLSEEAVKKAKQADQMVQSGDEIGLLHGVPVTIKINVDVKGQANSNGVKAMAGVIAPGDSPVVHNLKKAGAIIFGMTNTPEFSMRMMTDNPLYGLTRNPWHPDFTCGGSSGGAASCVAAGIGPVAHGNDIGGSLRIPALCCGVAAIRPTFGRIPTYNPSQSDDRPLAAQLFSVQGPIAREVRDLRMTLGAMAGQSSQDPWWVPVPLDGPALSNPIKVAVTRAPAGITPHPAIAGAIDTAAQYLADAGYEVVEMNAPFSEELSELWKSLIFSEMKTLLGQPIQDFGSKAFHTFLQECYKCTQFLDKEGYMRGLITRTRILREWLMFLEEYPLVLAPLMLKPSFKVGEDLQGGAKVMELVTALEPSFSINVLGLPSAAVPVALDQGVPHGVQIVGQRFREDICLNAAEKIEQRTGILSQQLWDKK